MGRRASALLVMVALVLAGASAAAIATIYRSARHAVDELQTRRLEAAGTTAARLLDVSNVRNDVLADVAAANQLDGAYVVDAQLMVIADAHGRAGRRANLLRLDADRTRRGLAGAASVAWAYDVEGASFLGGYFPLRVAGNVLVLEAGETFAAPSRRVRVMAWAAFVVDAAMLALALVGIAWAAGAVRREREAYGQAERAGLASRMAAMVAHEVRNPLSIIHAAAELLRNQSSSGQAHELVDDILGEVKRLTRLTDEFLTLTRDPPLERHTVQLERLAEEVSNQVAMRYHDRALVIGVHGAATAEVDESKLRQVLLNLVLNAAQAVDGCGTVRIDLDQLQGRARIRVSDDGAGISSDMAGRLFEPFATGKATGTGLGLAVARRIVERHGGTLTLVPIARGACFEAQLPTVAENP
jgi:two-component system OmpR family sensor kinase